MMDRLRILLPVAAGLLNFAWALQVQSSSTDQSNHAVVESNAYAQCSLHRDAYREQRLYGARRGSGASAESSLQLAQAGCSTFEATGGVDYVTLLRHSENKSTVKEPLAVWVASYPRSGSSTILSMISATVDDNRDGGDTFSLFEPCHNGDEYGGDRQKDDCGSVLYDLSHCDFSHIQKLWGWADPHSTNGHGPYSANKAHELCSSADVVAFKTVDWGHDLSKWAWFLDSHPNMKVIDVVRDPRGIYASWKALEPFATLVKTGSFYTIAEVCEHYSLNLDFNDTRVHRIIFEKLMSDPETTARAAYSFLGLPFGSKQLRWVQDVFHRTWCPEPPPGMAGYTDCHVESQTQGVAEKWRNELSEQELTEFASNADCHRVLEAYGYLQ